MKRPVLEVLCLFEQFPSVLPVSLLSASSIPTPAFSFLLLAKHAEMYTYAIHLVCFLTNTDEMKMIHDPD